MPPDEVTDAAPDEMTPKRLGMPEPRDAGEEQGVRDNTVGLEVTAVTMMGGECDHPQIWCSSSATQSQRADTDDREEGKGARTRASKVCLSLSRRRSSLDYE